MQKAHHCSEHQHTQELTKNKTHTHIHTYSVTYSSGVQVLTSPSGMNLLFIGVSKVTLK